MPTPKRNTPAVHHTRSEPTTGFGKMTIAFNKRSVKMDFGRKILTETGYCIHPLLSPIHPAYTTEFARPSRNVPGARLRVHARNGAGVGGTFRAAAGRAVACQATRASR